MTGFKPYRRKGGDIQAQPLDSTVNLPDEEGNTGEFVAGDYLILQGNGLIGEKKETFESIFEPVRKNYNKPKGEKKAKAEAEKAAA